MKVFILIAVFSFSILGHVGHKHTPAWKRSPSSTDGVLKGKIRDGHYSGLTHEFDPRQRTLIDRLTTRQAFVEKDYIIKKSHGCDLEVSSSSESLTFIITTKPIHYYKNSPKQKWKRATKSLEYQKDSYNLSLSVPADSLLAKTGYPKSIGEYTILSEVPGKEPFTLKRMSSSVVEGGVEYSFLMGEISFTLTVTRGGMVKFFNLHDKKTAPSEDGAFDRYGVCFIRH